MPQVHVAHWPDGRLFLPSPSPLVPVIQSLVSQPSCSSSTVPKLTQFHGSPKDPGSPSRSLPALGFHLHVQQGPQTIWDDY
jgi:hypothetical protein